MVYHFPNFIPVFKGSDVRNLMFGCFPSPHSFEIHQKPLARCIIINDEYRPSIPFYGGAQVVVLKRMVRRKRIFDLSKKFVHIFRPHHFPWPLNLKHVFHFVIHLLQNESRR
jgi:hypothetical protein